jgi:DNA-binding cell septation regulator SpoVG
MGIKHRLTFLGFFEGTDEMFIATYKPKYPNHTFQIFRHVRKPLSKNTREAIEKSTEIKAKLRDYNLSKLLD